MNIFSKVMDGRTIKVYPDGAEGAPTVYSPMFMEAGESLISECRKIASEDYGMDCPAFNLVSISNLHWYEDLSPWAHDPVLSKADHFTGGAKDFEIFMKDQVIPLAEQVSGNAGPVRVLAGYSLAGLFAVYAPYISDEFQCIVSASGSLWFPDFTEWALGSDFVRKPESVYLSLGDRESKTRNEIVNRNQANTEALRSHYEALGIRSVFELNPGNHFNNATHRLAKGIVWTLIRK